MGDGVVIAAGGAMAVGEQAPDLPQASPASQSARPSPPRPMVTATDMAHPTMLPHTAIATPLMATRPPMVGLWSWFGGSIARITGITVTATGTGTITRTAWRCGGPHGMERDGPSGTENLAKKPIAGPRGTLHVNRCVKSSWSQIHEQRR